ncbi:hypothetical protein [Microbacterium sp. GXF7504]
MSAPELVPRRPIGGIVGVWIGTALAGLAIVLFVPAQWQIPWVTVVLGASLVDGFVVQLAYGRPQRFIQRMALTVVGSFLILGVITAVAALTTLLRIV